MKTLNKIISLDSFQRLVIVPLKRLIDKKAEEITDIISEMSEQTQSDWNQTDETQNDYIKNKPIEETEDDALELLAEMGVLEVTVDTDGSILTDENNNILTV